MSDSGFPKWGPRLGISNKLPDDAGTADQGTTLWNHMGISHISLPSLYTVLCIYHCFLTFGAGSFFHAVRPVLSTVGC